MIAAADDAGPRGCPRGVRMPTSDGAAAIWYPLSTRQRASGAAEPGGADERPAMGEPEEGIETR
jgi:hypothetical protein